MIKIKVKNSGIVKLQSFNDFPDGLLAIGESKKNIPIEIKRFYVINNLFNNKSIRGKHAHKRIEQYIFCLNGKFTLNLDDGKKKQSIVLNKPYYGIKLGAMLWHSMKKFSKNCVILVIADDYYDESDYIRDYDEFLKSVHGAKK